MAYHGNCCVCVLTLCLCIFGSLAASTGVSLLLNVRLFDGSSATPRTLPAGGWSQALAITMTSCGALMFLLGMLIAISCLTVGIGSDKTDKSNYKPFDSESDIGTDEPVVEVAKRDTQGPATAKVLAQHTAYDVAFTPQDDIMNRPPVADSGAVPPSTEPSPPSISTSFVTRWTLGPSVPDGSDLTTGDIRVDYPSVLLGEPTEDVLLNKNDKQPLIHE